VAQRNIQHFDHTFKADLHTASGHQFTDVFDEVKFAKRPLSVVCKSNQIELVEEVGITTRKTQSFHYHEVTGIFILYLF
jgi:hypothetical protein